MGWLNFYFLRWTMKRLSMAVAAAGFSSCVRRKLVVLAGVAALGAPGLAIAQARPPVEEVNIPGTDIPGWGKVTEVQGRFARPANAGPKGAAVLILHSSGGVDGTGDFYAEALHDAGIATLEIRMFHAGSRPHVGTKATMPHAAAALKWLAARPDVDGLRLGVMGFSWGGIMSMMMSNDSVQQRLGRDVPRPAAFAPLYPVCTTLARAVLGDPKNAYYGFLPHMRAAPMLIQVGTRDDYEEGDRPCDALVAAWPPAAREHVTVRYIEGATHSFDTPRAGRQTYDHFARGGRGGTVQITPSRKDAVEARQAVVAFFVKTLMP
jgi:dienelactone hydrolase